MHIMRSKEVHYETLDYESRLSQGKTFTFPWTELKKNKRYYGYNFAYLMWTNRLQIVLDFIIYSVITSYFYLVFPNEPLTCPE